MSHDTPYSRRIRVLAEGRINKRVPNGEPGHAAELFKAMFDTADFEVCIFSECLHNSVFDRDDVTSSIEEFLLRPDVKLRVLVQDSKRLGDRPIWKLLTAEYLTSKPEVRQATGSFSGSEVRHFAVVDRRGFRFEIDHQASAAIANFNEPATAAELQNAFEEGFRSGNPLALN